MKTSSLIKIVAMILVLCFGLTSCGVIFNRGHQDEVETSGSDTTTTTPGSTTIPDPTPDKPDPEKPGDKPEVCLHTETKLRGAKEATCAVLGYTGDKVCKNCGEVVETGTTIAMKAHVYDEGQITKNPTCMETGIFTYFCVGCGKSQSEALPTVGHSDVYHDLLDGTHSHTCSNCTMSENEAHTPVDAGVSHPATCSDKAYIAHTCSVCEQNYRIYDYESELLAHNYGDWAVVEATCVSDGCKVHVCGDCGFEEAIVLYATPDVHNHVFAGYVDGKAPSCNEGAQALYVCSDCGEDSYTINVPATGLHNYIALEDKGDGWSRKECDGCGKTVSTFDASTIKEAEVKAEAIPDDVPFNVETKEATMEFPVDVIEQLKGGEDVKIGADILTDEAKKDVLANATNLDEDEKKRLEDVELFDFNVTIDGAALSENFAVAVTVRIPYTLKTIVDDDGNEYLEDKDGIVIWYVAADGTIEKITDVVYDEDSGTVTFLAPHFSMYAVAYEETQEMKCRRGNHAYEVLRQVTASCSMHGFTLYECTCCHRQTVDNIVEKLHHNYGEVLDPNPTCDSGDYYKRICSDCGDVKLLQYVRALGHKIDAVATCSTASYCTRCDSVVTPALGHSWSEWKIVVPAGELTQGLRVRYCLRCGETQSTTLASTGNISSLEFETHEEMFEYLYDIIVGMSNGVVEFSYVLNGNVDVNVKATVNRDDVDTLVLVEYTGTQRRYNGEMYTLTGKMLYKNGAMIVGSSEDDAPIDDVQATNLSSLILAPVNVVINYMEQIFDYFNPYAEQILAMSREQLENYIELFGAEINEVLANAGSAYTVEELHEILDSIETVYAYVALKLGFTTEFEINEDVVVPTRRDLLNFMKGMMEATVDGENTTYSVNVEPLMEAINTALSWVYDRLGNTLDEVIFEVLGDKLLEIDASITDMDALCEYLKTTFPGTLTVADAIDKLAVALEEKADMTLADLYELIETVVLELYGEEIDAEAMVDQYAELTLNELLSAMYGTEEEIAIEDLYDAIATNVKGTTLGEIYLRRFEASLEDFLPMIKSYLEMLTIDADFSFTLDRDGNLVSITLDEFVVATMPGEEGEADQEITLQKIYINIIRDEHVMVIIPDEFKKADVEIKTEFDSEGNLVISGLPTDAEIDVSLSGNGIDIELQDVLVRDAEMSTQLGFDVYVAPKEFWSSTSHVASLLLIDGKYYTFSQMTESTREDYSGRFDLFRFVSDPYSILPAEGEYTPYSYEGTPVYLTGIGLLAQFDGEWWVCQGAVKYEGNIGSLYLQYRFDERFMGQTLEISSISTYGYYPKDSYRVSSANINIYVGGETYQFSGEVKAGEGVELVYTMNNYYYDYYSRLDEEVRLDSFDYESTYTYTDTRTVLLNGEYVKMVATVVNLQRYLPTYYAKISEGVYVDVEQYYIQNYNVATLDTMQLSDGNTMYVVGCTEAVRFGYAYGEIYYGYVRLGEKMYMRVYCIVQDGMVMDVHYEYGSTSIWRSYNDLFNVEDYMTVKPNGTIVISKDLVNKLLEYCDGEGSYVYFNVYADMIIDGVEYSLARRVCVEFNPERLTISGSIGGSNISRPDNMDIFYQLFYGQSSESPSQGVSIYVDENGDLVLFCQGSIHNINANFGDRFPADSMLEYNAEESKNLGYKIYTFEGEDRNSSSYVYKDGKYYNYYTESNYSIKTDSLANLIKNNWQICDLRYRYNIYPSADVPEELHDQMVYDVQVAFTTGAGCIYRRGMITLYAIVLDGQLQILTGAVPSGESLLTFEGYVPVDEYFESLVIRADGNTNEYTECYINGTKQRLTNVLITLTESVYGVSKNVYIYRTENGQYVYDSSYLDQHITIENQVSIPSHYKFESIGDNKYCNGTYQIAWFEWVQVRTYRAIEIGGKFYDYNDFDWSYWNDDFVITEQEFRDKMYNTDRVYMAGDRYYNKFIPGEYLVMTEEIYDFVLPENYTENYLGNTEDDYCVYEIWFYVSESMDDRIETVQLEGGDVFYHVDGAGYIKIANTNVYVKAVLFENSNGEEYPVCLVRTAYLEGWWIDQYDILDKYFSNDGQTIVIPVEMLDILKAMPDWCYFSVDTSYGSYHFDYYTLETYFMNGGSLGGNGGGNKDEGYVSGGDKDEGYISGGDKDEGYISGGDFGGGTIAIRPGTSIPGGDIAYVPVG